MTEFPFELLIRDSSLSNSEKSLTCLSLLRAVPGRRAVYDAQWQGRAVIVKVFMDKLSAKRHLKREWRGLEELQERGLSGPVPLFFGKTQAGDIAMVMEKISDAAVVMDVFLGVQDSAAKVELLNMICDELSREHGKGVLQKDLHLGNFLLQGEKRLFVIDPAQMRFYREGVDRGRAIGQLAMLAVVFPEDDVEDITNFCKRYAANRDWEFTGAEMAVFWKKLAACRNRGLKKGLEKCLHTNKRYLRVVGNGNYAIGRKDFFDKINIDDFFQNIDDLMRSGQILKDGNTCFVSRVNLAGKDVVIKRYNHKGLNHSIRHTLKRSRARRNWLHAHRLGMLGVSTARPLAFIENRKGPIVHQAYFIAEHIDGPKLCDFLKDEGVTKQQRAKVALLIGRLLGTLGRHRITHGDLKHSNILIVDDRPVLIDLDSMQMHCFGWLFNIKKSKDLVHIDV